MEESRFPVKRKSSRGTGTGSAAVGNPPQDSSPSPKNRQSPMTLGILSIVRFWRYFEIKSIFTRSQYKSTV